MNQSQSIWVEAWPSNMLTPLSLIDDLHHVPCGHGQLSRMAEGRSSTSLVGCDASHWIGDRLPHWCPLRLTRPCGEVAGLGRGPQPFRHVADRFPWRSAEFPQAPE